MRARSMRTTCRSGEYCTDCQRDWSTPRGVSARSTSWRVREESPLAKTRVTERSATIATSSPCAALGALASAAAS